MLLSAPARLSVVPRLRVALKAHRVVCTSTPRYPPLPPRFMDEPQAKKPKMSHAHKTEASFQVSGLHVTDHVFTVPLDHTGESAHQGRRRRRLPPPPPARPPARPTQSPPPPARPPAGRTPGEVEVFCREVCHRNKKEDRTTLPYLLFLQGASLGAAQLQRALPLLPAAGRRAPAFPWPALALHFITGDRRTSSLLGCKLDPLPGPERAPYSLRCVALRSYTCRRARL